MASVVIPIGVTCLGIVVGWMVRYFIRRFTKFGPGVLSSLLSIILGGAVLKFLSVDNVTIWFYPIGLFVGFVAYQVIVMTLIKGDVAVVDAAPKDHAPKNHGKDVFKHFPADEPRFLIKPPK